MGKAETAINNLEVAIDASGTNYDYRIGRRLGRTIAKEHYAFFYNTNVATSSCTCDRIISNLTLNEDYTGTLGVFRFHQKFELDCAPKEISDHSPVVA